MNFKYLPLAALALISHSNAQAQDVKARAVDVTAPFINIKGEEVGKAVLKETENGVLVHLELKNMPAGEHAMHIHQNGNCTPVENEGDATGPKDYFTNAGGHLNPHEHAHGYMRGDGPHAGDMPNIIIPESGELKTQIFNDMVSLNGSDTSGRALLLDDGGSAIIIHEGADDYTSQPTGAAGDRIACAAFIKDKKKD